MFRWQWTLAIEKPGTLSSTNSLAEQRLKIFQIDKSATLIFLPAGTPHLLVDQLLFTMAASILFTEATVHVLM